MKLNLYEILVHEKLDIDTKHGIRHGTYLVQAEDETQALANLGVNYPVDRELVKVISDKPRRLMFTNGVCFQAASWFS